MPQKINVIDSNPIGEKYCKMCVTTKLILYEKDELIFKCRTCGSLFKYNQPIKKASLGIDPELDNEAKSAILFYKPAKAKKKSDFPEVSGNVTFKGKIDVR